MLRGRRGRAKHNDETLFADTACREYTTLVKQLEVTKNKNLAQMKLMVDYAKNHIPEDVLNVPLRQLRMKQKTPDLLSSFRRRSLSYTEAVTKPIPQQHNRSNTTHHPLRWKQDTNKKSPVISSSKYVITSKVGPDTPVGILRIPRDGEFAVSADGSPLLVSCSQAKMDKANVTIPLSNGKVVSVFPKPNLDTSSVKDNIDGNVKEQLETLIHSLQAMLPKY